MFLKLIVMTYEQKKLAAKLDVINGSSINSAVINHFKPSEITDAMRCMRELKDYFCNAFC